MSPTTTSADRHRILAGPTRARLLEELRRSGGAVGVRHLADTLSLHPNSVREQLTALADAGLVTVEPSPAAGRGRPSLHYRVTADGESADADAYVALAGALVAQIAAEPDPAGAAVEAGERWGRRLGASGAARSSDDPPALLADPPDPVRDLVGILGALGFRPTGSAGTDAPIRLERCPFADLARERADVVCGIHLGLMRGVLRERRAGIDVVLLIPFVEQGLCLAHLGAARHV